jgi:VanZ family protein
MRDFLVYHLPALLYAGLIIAASSIPNLKTPKLVDFQLDKAIHFIEYALFAFLTYRSAVHISSKVTQNRALILSSIFVLGFAILDEFYQKYVPGRDSGIGDLSMDLIGAALVLILLWIREKRLNKK